MGKQAPKMSARVVNAIKNLREVHGSTSKEIMSYIMSQYNAPVSTIQRQMQTALKRGLDYGILKRQNGHYYLNTESRVPQMLASNTPAERNGRRRSRRRRSRRRGRRRRRSRGRRSRRRRSGRSRPGGRSRKAGCTNCRCTRRARELQILKDTVAGPRNTEDDDAYTRNKDSDVERRSKSRDRSGSRSRSSINSDQDAATDDRQATHDQD
ncbi:uncharacterized protein LOC117219059 [Megalopta genalis]|uniref:uncharacterized protein LOC117219059 n=1 Tax=Megalopta genalis TaxID=115081 RepID=UPI001443856B|nr:serine/arginine-rich splicing factor 7-like [Megalopta genalis]